MTQRVRSKAPQPKEFVGFTFPLKEILGVGAYLDERRPDMDRALKALACDLTDRVFRKQNPTYDEISEKIEDGTLMDFRKSPSGGTRSKARVTVFELPHYMESLAYHHYIKRDTFRIATKHNILITQNPLSDVIDYPLETLIVPTKKNPHESRRAVVAFLDELREHMLDTYGIKIKNPDEIRDDKIQNLVWHQINDTNALMTPPGDFRANLKRQTPPDTDDIRNVREWFNGLIRNASHRKRRFIEEAAKGDYVEETELLPGIKWTSHTTSKQRLKILTRDRI